jgi:hypothetical protein
MTSLIPYEKEVSFIHFNPDYGYMAYIEKALDVQGEPIWRVVRVSLGGQKGRKLINRS